MDKKHEIDIERRIRMLEEEVQKMKEPLEKTLMDIRGLINELENPFEYVTKLIGTFPVRELKPDEGVTKPEQKPRQQSPPAEHTIEATPQAHASTERHIGGVMKFLNVLALTSLMVRLIGRERLLSMLSSTFWRALIPSGTIIQIIESLEMLNRFENDVRDSNFQKAPTIEDGLIAAYLLNRLAEGDDDPLFMLLLLVVNKLQYDSDNALSARE